MSATAEFILHNVGLSRERVGELCERYGHAIPAKPRPPERDLRGCRFHRVVRSASTSTEGGAK